MKKFYTLLTLCLAFFGITTATAQNAPQFSNYEVYTVKNKRSAWIYYFDMGFTTTTYVGGMTLNSITPEQRFAFLTKDGGKTYYLYSLPREMFINKDGMLSATADCPVKFKKGNVAGTWVVYFDDRHYINVDSKYYLVIDDWSTPDDGNSNVFKAVGDFNPMEALKGIPDPVVPQYPFIKSVSELSNNKLYTVVQKSHSQGATSWAIAAGGDAFVSSKQVKAIAGREDDTKQLFAFLTYEEKIYLYHPAEKKFVNKDASLSATPVDAITLLDGAFENTFMVKFDDSHYVNVNSMQNMSIDGWSAADGGNSCTISAVADFDPTEVLKLFVPVPTEIVGMTPVVGEVEAMPTTITLAFNNDIKALEFGQLRTNATGRAGYTFTEEDYTIAGKELTLNLPENLVAGQPNLNITLSVIDKNDMYVTYASNPDYATDGYITLEYTAPINADLFAMASSDPAAGNVEKLDVINVTFGNPNYSPQFPGQTQTVGGIDASKEVTVVDAEGNVVTTATMEIVQANGWNSNTVKFTLATPITEVGAYTLVIPAATVYNEMYDEYAEDFGVNWGAIYNPEVRIAYTIAAPDGINNIIMNGKVDAYTLDGRKVNNPTKGIYVINGKKVYVK